MKETGILMTGSNVKLLIDDLKTQTRRVVKPQPEIVGDHVITCLHWKGVNCGSIRGNGQDCLKTQCPYGQVGDRLWVRELLREERKGAWFYDVDNAPVMVAKSDELAMRTWTHHKEQDYCSSMFMPKWACRLWLEITEVRVEQINQISEEDAKAEGMGNMSGLSSFVTSFRWYWDSINAAPKPQYCKKVITHYTSYPWEAIQEVREYRGLPWYVCGNPWAWALSFKKITKEEG